MYKKGTKIIASILVFMLAFSNLSVIGLYGQEVLASDKQVSLKAYFTESNSGDSDKIKTTSKVVKIGDENYFNIDLSFSGNGYLENSIIDFSDANFTLDTARMSNEEVYKPAEGNKIIVNQTGHSDILNILVPFKYDEAKQGKLTLENATKINKIKLTGTYVTTDGVNQTKTTVEETVELKLTWKATSILKVVNQKVIPYEVDGNKGLMAQVTVQSSISNNMLATNKTEISFDVPTILDVIPTVSVRANTQATNGDKTGSNIDVKQEDGKVTISVENKIDKDKNIIWQKDVVDEFVITYLFGEEVINKIIEQGSYTFSNEIKSKIYAYENSKDILKLEDAIAQVSISHESITEDNMFEKKTGEFVDVSLEKQTNYLQKGQMYANYDAIAKVETEFKQNITADITYKDLIDEVIIEEREDIYYLADTEVVSNDTYNKTISISKESFDKVLGQEGTIKIYSFSQTEPKGILVETIDKDTTIQDGNYIIDISSANARCIRMVTSKPQSEGKLQVQVLKAFLGDLTHTEKQLKTYKALGLAANVKANNVGEEVINLQDTQVKTSIELREPTTKAEATISNTSLSTVVTNQDVKITAILKTDTLDCNLYENPIIEFRLPAEIENINVDSLEVLFETEGSKLTAKNASLIPNQDGTKTICIELEGKQTEYTLGSVSKGVNVVVIADITVNRKTPSKNSNITVKFTNRNDAPEAVEVAMPISFVAPVGVFTISSMSNYTQGNTLAAISEEEKTGLIETIAEARNVTITKEVVNNYNDKIENISILGRVPFEGNKHIVSGEDLGTTINMPLTSAINVSGIDASNVQIYYSENLNATKDLNDSSNSWTLTPANLANVKSYLINVVNKELAQGESISYSYNVQIPANLQHNELAYENSVTYFDNNQTGTIGEKVVATKLGVTTGTGPVLEVKMSSNVDEETVVKEGRFIKYTMSVKNTGNEIAENVVATINIPKCTNYIEFYNGEAGYYQEDFDKTEMIYELGNMRPNQTIGVSFWVVVRKIEEQDICQDESHFITIDGEKCHDDEKEHLPEEFNIDISAKASVTAKDMSNAVKSNEVKNSIDKANFKIETNTSSNSIELLSEGQEMEYTVLVQTFSSDITSDNTIVTIPVPEGLTYKEAKTEQYNLEEDKVITSTEGITYNKNSNSLEVNLGTIESNNNKKVIVIFTVNNLTNDAVEKEIVTFAKVKADGKEEELSQKIVDKVAKEKVTIKQTCTIPSNVPIASQERFTYTITVQNDGALQATNINVYDYIPNELRHICTSYMVGEHKKEIYHVEKENLVDIKLNLAAGEKVEITVQVEAKDLKEEAQITNVVKVSSNKIGTIEANKITNIVEKSTINYDEEEDFGEGEDSSVITRNIAGTVWFDKDNNGIKDENEEKVSEVEVLLFDNNSGELVKDNDGNIVKTTTNEDGSYVIKKVSKGNYTVIFLYDTANYSATTYRKKDVDETKNSDAVDSEITLEGELKNAAITEEVNVTDSNIYNLDLGLIENKKFDLKLDKVVSKITIQDSNGTNVYDLKDTKLAKKDLVGKDVNNTTIIVEYKMTVTNEGAIPGYVKKIADYLPSEMKFNSELNREWYTGENGIIYSSSLANTLIKPGESKTVTLVLTKKMTEENLGAYSNTAEIYEAYNDLGIEDFDSIEGNKKANEDDISSAEILITVKTGEVLLFIGLTITIIATIGIGAYFIKKKVLR